MRQRYYRYAGYHEILISKRVLRKPYVILGWHRSIGAAIEAAERMEPEAVVFDKDLAGEAAGYYFGVPFLHEDLERIQTFNGRKHEINRGLTGVTLECLQKRFDCLPSAGDLRDMANWLALRTRSTFRKALSFLEGKDYSQIHDILAPYTKALKNATKSI